MMLFEKYEASLSKELIANLKALVDRNLGDTKGAIDAIFYTLLAGLIRRANSDMSTNMLVNQIQRIYEKDLKVFNTDNSYAEGKGLAEFVRVGERNMSQIFPSFKSQLLNLVTSHSGTSKSETNRYAGFVNSLVIKSLAEKLNDGISKDDLMNYLKEHRDPLFDKAPESLMDKMIPALGIHDLKNMKLYYAKKTEEKEGESKHDIRSGGEVVFESQQTYEEAESEHFNKRTLLIVGVGALTLLLCYFIYHARNEIFGSPVPQESQVIDLDENVIFPVDSLGVDVSSPGDAGWLALRELLNSPGVTALNTDVKIESLSFVGDSVALSNMSNSVIDSIVYEFKINPRFQIQIKGGHGGGNSQIGLKRAFGMKRLLQSKGVDTIRIDAISDSENLDYLKFKLVSK
ncbi:MAG: VIT1/CCC1 family predicted Fe2+/Mn2+ transporter [Algoriphagus sp.]|jgi:VIT1/CCC1 family predicted Fe2+/Mn2+ transporter